MTTSIHVALVTGAGSGMGQRAAIRMAKAGARVAGIDLDERGLAKTKSEAGGSVSTFVCDVLDLDKLRRTVEKVEKDFGPIDRVVHAAGIMPGAPLLDEDPERTKRVMRVNYDGTVNVVHATMPKMVARGRGEIVCFGSVAGEALTPRLGAYCASKAAVNAYVEILARETAGTGVRVHLTCPPMVDTPLLNQSLDSAGPRSLTQAIEKKMLAKPDDVLDAIEKALAKGAVISHPLATSKALHALRRFAPGLLWKVIQKAEDEAAKSGNGAGRVS